MESIIKKTMQRAVTAHKDGALKEAEGLYRSVLQYQPTHAGANHNLGVLAVSMNNPNAALASFKTALKANPKIEHFWLSYIDALIQVKQFENAKQVLKQAKKKGIDGNRLNALEGRLPPETQKSKTAGISPPQELLDSLIENYQSGRLHEAEKLAISITQEFSEHAFGWKVLGAIFKRLGKIRESFAATQKSVQLEPQDAKAHYNLGNTLTVLGRLDEAVASFHEAIELKPSFAEAYSNLGNTLKRLGRLVEAKAKYNQAIALKPDLAEAHSNLGLTLQELGRLDEAEVSYKQAIVLRPDLAEAYYNLGYTLQELGRLKEAEANYAQAITLEPENSSARHMLAALTGVTTVTAPRSYVEGLFDNYAAKFESSLVDNLDYKIPRAIAEMIMKDSKLNFLGSIMDLGCGTGLFGIEIKRFCEYLEGIDLSKKMLDEARKKNTYDKLIKGDILNYLSNASLNFDYFIATDVFIYIGDLSDIFRLIKSRNEAGGKLVFSTEDYDGDSFFLEQSGRYSHSKKYIEGLCKKNGYELRHFETQALRKGKNQYISGGLYILEF